MARPGDFDLDLPVSVFLNVSDFLNYWTEFEASAAAFALNFLYISLGLIDLFMIDRLAFGVLTSSIVGAVWSGIFWRSLSSRGFLIISRVSGSLSLIF